MVNTGRPSEGCVQCRARHIKCDTGRPQCQRCIKYGVVCPGYPAKDTVKFRDDTDRVRERAFKKYGISQKKRAMSIQPTANFGGDKIVSDSSHEVPLIFSAIRSDLKSQARSDALYIHTSGPALIQGAVAAFLTHWETPNTDVLWGAYDSAPMLYSICAPDSCFRLAIEALSLLAMAMPEDASRFDIRKAAIHQYGKTLRAINKALEDPTQQLTDQTFSATLFIAYFEGVVEVTETGAAPKYVMHMQGLMTMVELRGREQLNRPTGRKLFILVSLLWNMGAIALPLPMVMPLSKEIQDTLVNRKLGKHERTFRLLPLAHQSLILRNKAMLVLQNPVIDESTLYSLHAEALELDRDLLEWYIQSPPGYWSNRQQLYGLLTLNIFRAHRIFLRDLTIRCLQRLSTLDGCNRDAEIGKNVAATQEIVDEICATIPYNFGEDDPHARKEDIKPGIVPDVGMDFLYHTSFSFPLLVVSMVDSLPLKQKEGIEKARRQCAAGQRLLKPFRTFPAVLAHAEPSITVSAL